MAYETIYFNCFICHFLFNILFIKRILLHFTDKFFLFKIDLHVYNRESYDSDVFVWG